METTIERQERPVDAGFLARAGDLFQLLRDGRARTRAELAEQTGLARTTVAARIDALLAMGLVGPAGEAASSGGRPPSNVTAGSKRRPEGPDASLRALGRDLRARRRPGKA